MRCRNPDTCPCMEHVDPATHVPVCPYHRIPLVPSDNEPGKGFCLLCLESGRHAHHSPEGWAWCHRDVFYGGDVPPHNGFQPIHVPEELL